MALLHLTYSDLMSAIGNYLAFGFDSSTYATAQTNTCERILQSGLRRFYYTRNVVDGAVFTGWSFMNPTTTLSLVSGTRTYTLASDFGDIDGTFTWGNDDQRPDILLISDQNIRNMYAARDADGYPVYASIKRSTFDGTAAQTWDVTFFPEPNAADTLTYRYFADPLVLTSGANYTLGGPSHAETIKEACLAQAELESDDQPGIHTQQFERLLESSIRLDRIANTPEYLGKMIDRSDWAYQSEYS